MWLETDLANTQKRWKFVIIHEPAWSAEGGHGNDEASQQYLCPLFEHYGVAIVHSGHNHYYARGVVNGVQHITAGGGGAPLYMPDLNYPNVVTAENTHHFVRYDISGGRLTVTVIRDDGSIIESFHVNKPISMPWMQLLLLDD